MSERVLLLNTGIANLQSVGNALEYLAAPFTISDDAREIELADKIVFPGVGTYGNAMDRLREKGLVLPLRRALQEQKKICLGICVGMQVLSSVGLEFGEHEGLGVIPGQVGKVEFAGPQLPLPHVGWNDITVEGNSPLFRQIETGASFYFVHSYCFRPSDAGCVTATVDYGGRIAASIQRENVFGVQFHPEKSQEHGLHLLRNFLEL